MPANSSNSFPWLTNAVLAILVAVFIAEIEFGVSPPKDPLDPSIATLIAFGGLMRSLVVGQGEWYRVFSAPLLHASATHLAFNGFALLIAGRALEGLIGRAWLAAILIFSALAGSIVSLALSPANMVSVGASGGITGLFAAMLAVSLRLPHGPDRAALQRSAVYVLVPTLLPLTSGISGGNIDYGAHLGGTLGGFAIGALMVSFWRPNDYRPRFRHLALAAALIGATGFVYAALPLAKSYSTAQLQSLLIPSGQLPQSDAEAKAQSAPLVKEYPRDPRAHLMRASALIDAKDFSGAEKELRAGLAEEDSWRSLFPGTILSVGLRSLLAYVLSRDRMDEARAVAKPICDVEKTPQQRSFIDKLKVCDE